MDRARLERELVLHHQDAWGWALDCCRFDREIAADVLQDAYLRVLDGRAHFGGRAAFRTWLFGVVRRVALEHRRSAGRRDRRFGGGDPPDEPSLDPGPAERLATAERACLLREGLGRLPDRQREVLHLVFYQGMTIAEAAGVMGVRLGTARTHYKRGKRTLRAELSGLEEG